MIYVEAHEVHVVYPVYLCGNMMEYVGNITKNSADIR